MLDFSDKPYRFFPPQPNSLIIALAKQINRRLILPGPKHRVTEISLRHADRIVPLIKAGHRCLFLPNHSTHSDPQLMLEVQRRLRTCADTMAAYDVFLRGKFGAWLMQRIGCFSVDREGSDSQSMKCAVDTLVEGRRALTIFPEGNVLLMNDRVSQFLGGAAFIGLRAQKKLGKQTPVFAVPISLKFSQLSDCSSSLEQHILGLESMLEINADESSSLRLRMRAIGVQILTRNLRKRGFMPPATDHDDLPKLLEESVTQIVVGLERKMELNGSENQSLADRIRVIRSTIHSIRIDESQQLDHKAAGSWADEAMLALRILSYSSDYISDSPSLDRHCETLEKLREDVADKILPPLGDRKAFVQFGEPINLSEHVEKKSRVVLPELTALFESAVQNGLDEINEANDCPGASLLPS
jgi:hypothetical protein